MCLITPLTDEDISSYSLREYGRPKAPSIAHRQDSEAVVKKRKKGSKDSVAGNKGQKHVDLEVHEQATLSEIRLPSNHAP